MVPMSYTRVGKNGMGGFRLTRKRFSVQRLLRTKFSLFFIKVIARWKTSYGNAFEYLKKNLTRNYMASKRDVNGYSKRNLVPKDVTKVYRYRLKSFGQSNSFYSEAIADCLEFIKRTSEENKEED